MCGGGGSGGGVADRAKPDVETLVDATRGGVNQHIRPATQPTRPSLADAARIMDRLNGPAEAKWGAQSSHRQVITPEQERGLVPKMRTDGLFTRIPPDPSE